MNLKKLFPYISQNLNDILLHFTMKMSNFYENIENIIDDLNNAVSKLPPVNNPTAKHCKTNYRE
jgi:hypothetical protein